MEKIINNKKGIGLLQVIGLAGLLGLMAVGTMSVMDAQRKSISMTIKREDGLKLKNLMNNQLASPDRCGVILKGILDLPPGSVDASPDDIDSTQLGPLKIGAEYYSIGQKYGELEITNYMVDDLKTIPGDNTRATGGLVIDTKFQLNANSSSAYQVKIPEVTFFLDGNADVTSCSTNPVSGESCSIFAASYTNGKCQDNHLYSTTQNTGTIQDGEYDSMNFASNFSTTAGFSLTLSSSAKITSGIVENITYQGDNNTTNGSQFQWDLTGGEIKSPSLKSMSFDGVKFVIAQNQMDDIGVPKNTTITSFKFTNGTDSKALKQKCLDVKTPNGSSQMCYLATE